MNIEGIILRESQISHDLTYMWNLKNKTKKQTKQKQTHKDVENKRVVARKKGDGQVGGMGEGD